MTKKNIIRQFKIFLYYLLVWSVASTYYFFFRFYGIGFDLGNPMLNNYFSDNFSIYLKFLILPSSIGALAYTYIRTLLTNKFFRQKSYFYIFMSVSLIHLIMFITISIIFSLVGMYIDPRFTGSGVWESILFSVFKPETIPAFLFTLIVGDILVCEALVSNHFGKGVLLNLIIGKYHTPREQDRIFMFLDLKSSTIYAEKLGHLKYSQMIQDCFVDLSDAVSIHDVEIYQYVGDEAVLTWEMKDGIRNNNAVETFFTFKDILRKRKKYYMDKYGVLPEFKAGINMGMVTIAEVGVVKREIAYHSDVLNTASRIQSKCNELKKELLVSSTFFNSIDNKQYSYKSHGDLPLKGKQEEIEIFSIDK